jgi:hypothetical protein
MRGIVVIFLFCSSFIFCSCGPHATEASIPSTITLDGYGAALDSSYYKVWNDSSWEEFYQDTTINGNTYTTILDSYGNEYFYDSSGYSGLMLYGNGAFMFDTPLPPPPDTMAVGKTYTLQTNFKYQDTSYVLTDEETARGAFLVQVPIGTFANCPAIVSSETIANGGQIDLSSDMEYWLAKGPSDIQRDLIDYGGFIQQMVRGMVNGKYWGANNSMEQPGIVNRYPGITILRQGTVMRLEKLPADIRSIAPTILKGIVR